jgi:hypothetical protein
VLGDESESVVDMDAAKKGLECTNHPVDTPFHGIHPEAGPSRLFSDLVNSFHALFKRGQLLLLLCQI